MILRNTGQRNDFSLDISGGDSEGRVVGGADPELGGGGRVDGGGGRCFY